MRLLDLSYELGHNPCAFRFKLQDNFGDRLWNRTFDNIRTPIEEKVSVVTAEVLRGID